MSENYLPLKNYHNSPYMILELNAVYSIVGFVENGKGTSRQAEITKFLNSFKLSR